MSEMGGLRTTMPVTFVTFLIGTLALAGIPPFAGFWSKDEILVGGFKHDRDCSGCRRAAVGALMTAFYMTRCVLLTFFGEYRGTAHPHESPASMTGPLVVARRPRGRRRASSGARLGAVFGDWV